MQIKPKSPKVIKLKILVSFSKKTFFLSNDIKLAIKSDKEENLIRILYIVDGNVN